MRWTSRITVLALILFLTPFLHGPSAVWGLTWSTPAKITPLLSIETKPYVVEDNQGTLWVVYESLRSSNFDIYSRRWNGAIWLAEERLTTHASADQNPAIAQFQNGTMLLVWASDRSGVYSLYSKRLNGGVWSSETPLTTSPGTDSTPSLLQARNGTLWLFWTRRTISGPNVIYDIYYKTYTSGTWTSERPFVNTTASEYQQSIAQASDGRIWVLYASDKLGNFDQYYKTYNGSWSSETPLTTNGDDDRQGWIMQDLNGTIWTLWARCVTSGSACQDDVFYKVSYNQGSSWSSETQYTVDPEGIEIFDGEPSAVHARDGKVYLFWTTNLTGDGADFDIYYSTTPIPIVGLTGDMDGNGRVDILDVAMVAILFGSTLEPEDINGDCVVDILDLAIVAFSFGTIPGDPKWNSQADMDGNGRVDILDVATVAIVFGSTMGPEDLNRDCVIDILDLAIVAYHFGEGT